MICAAIVKYRDPMEKIVPLISSECVGLLGIRHLPRLWLKMLLYAQGALPEGYYHGNAGFDAALLKRFGIEASELEAYVNSAFPSYMEFEQWFVRTAKNLDPATIRAHNEFIRLRHRQPEGAAETRAFVGIDDPDLTHGITLNNLEDWTATYKMLAQRRARVPEAR